MSSANSFSLEESKICRLVMGQIKNSSAYDKRNDKKNDYVKGVIALLFKLFSCNSIEEFSTPLTHYQKTEVQTHQNCKHLKTTIQTSLAFVDW